MVNKYYNLTQNTTGRLVYFRSTDIEQANWKRLLWSIPDEWLFLLSKGEQIVLVDKTSNTNGGKIKRIFCPVFNDVLNNVFFGLVPENKQYIWHYNKAIQAIKGDKSLETKFKFWRNKATIKIRLIVESEIVTKEPNPLEIAG